MKHTGLITIDCEEKECGECRFYEYNGKYDNYDCYIFNVSLDNDFFRCQECLDTFKPLKPKRFGCHCDLEQGQEPDECVIDIGDFNGCIFYKEGMKKEDCEYWHEVKE